MKQFQVCLSRSFNYHINFQYAKKYHILKMKWFFTQKLIKLAFTIDKCCALSTIAKVSTYFPILMIGGSRVNAFFYVNYQKSRKLSQACLDLGLLLAILSIDHDVLYIKRNTKWFIELYKWTKSTWWPWSYFWPVFITQSGVIYWKLRS